MQKLKLTKVIASTLIAISVLAFNPISARAATTFNHIYTNPIYTKTIYADSYQWVYQYGNWTCARPDFHEPYANAWVCTNGKWYYVDENCHMVSNTWVDNYYVDDTGAWIQTSSSIITKAEAIKILMNTAKYINKPSEKDITLESIYNKQYYRIPVTFTYSFSDNGEVRYRTTSDSTRYIDIHTGIIYIDISGEFKKEN